MRRVVAALVLACLITGNLCPAQECDPQGGRGANPVVSVRKVQVQGGGVLTRDAEALIRTFLPERRYEICDLKKNLSDISDHVRFLYQNHGYAKALVQVLETTPAPEHRVDVVFTIEPGPVYRLQDIRFVHATAFPMTQLRALFPLRPGERWNARKFQIAIENLRNLYSSKGYINATPVPTPEFDDRSNTVLWTIDMDEGSVFTFGHLVLSGLEPAPGIGKKLLEAWRPYIGKTYTPDRLRAFAREYQILSGGKRLDLDRDFEITLDQTERVASVKLEFPTPLPH